MGKRLLSIFTIALGLLLVFFNAPEVLACLCAQPDPVCKAFDLASIVFVGTASGSEQVTAQTEVYNPGKGKESLNHSERLYRFTVEQNFKGVKGQEIEIQTGMGGGDCGFGFRQGERYLIYAYFDAKINKHRTSICSRTTAYSNAYEDLDYLKGLPDSATKTRISGTVTQIMNERDKSGSQKRQPMAGVKVMIVGETTTFESITNEANQTYRACAQRHQENSIMHHQGSTE
jgi:hypothetical protein